MAAMKLPTTEPQLLTVNQLCAALCMGRTKAYQLMDTGVIAYLMLGGVRRVPISEVARIVGEAKRAAKQALIAELL
ncbi:helix-turn-helix domain-containing protein [Pseudomonas sp. LS1212]|uniref:helix-turn-helix domain-containing protein n=1 Tax=Pseudomonas sp. LS1212 TaxID=2972478 RepID=UPI00215B9AA5|nr:helix-turn-helix domain-containing protein [Pseudomonas sp. LS1212]UVJ42850.1 helix-turn-helix domain-containing protein [Pseudomonas sp. LS1212]